MLYLSDGKYTWNSLSKIIYMDSVNEFLKIEINSVTKKKILDTIVAMRNSGNDNDIEDKEMTFNAYSLVFSKLRNEVRICNDIIPEISDACIPIGDFYNLLKQSSV
jgi:hypothetical protein